jgi:hypothetical protein
MNKIDVAMGRIRATASKGVIWGSHLPAIERILTELFGDVPDCGDCDLTIAYMNGYEDGKESRWRRLGTITTAGVDMAKPGCDVTAKYVGEQPIPQDVEKEIREKIADCIHGSWSGWMLYLLDEKAHENEDGTVTLSKDDIAMWRRKIGEKYENLTLDEQESDLAEAADVLTAIQPYLAVNDRRALVRLKEEMKGRYNKIYDHVGYASREEELEKWLNRIDALLAELPEPVKPFDVDALEDWVRKTTNGKNTRLIESDPPQQEFIYRQHILDKIAKLKGKS